MVQKNEPLIKATFNVEQIGFDQVLNMEILIPLNK